MRITPYGAARQVTGSCHLVETGQHRILVDCGLFQGKGAAELNRGTFGFDPSTVDHVVLTHAHLDHCGRLPLLVERGFTGDVITTPATRELARIVLLDSAKIQEEDARRRSRQAKRKGEEPVDPLYDTEDALVALDHFETVAGYGETVEFDSLGFTFEDAGHILGAAFVTLEAPEDGDGSRVVFSGDLGNSGKPIVRDPRDPPADVDGLVLESTYGNRNHRSIAESVEELFDVINETIRQGGNVLVPSFAIERSQELLTLFKDGIEAGTLPADLQVFLDSPMAISATRVFERHPECYDEETRRMFDEGRDPFDFEGLTLTPDPRDSKQINQVDEGAVIVAGSGMCEGGRILHHIKHHGWKDETSLVFVGFAPKGTRAREIIDGARRVHAAGEKVEVNASVHTINGFSAHAGRDELLAWWRKADPDRTVLVHGEEDVMETLANQMDSEGGDTSMPDHGDHVEL